MNEGTRSRAIGAVGRHIVPVILCFACAPSASQQGSTSREQQATFTNGDFEEGTEGVPPPGWAITSYLNQGVAYPPLSRDDLQLQPGYSLDTFTHVGAGPELEVDSQLGEDSTFRWPKYGTMATVVNENVASQFTNGMTQTQTIVAGDVDPSDGKAHVRFTVAPVLENPGHPADGQPYYFVELRNLTKGTLLYHDFNASAQPGVPWKVAVATTCYSSFCFAQERYYTDWQLVDIAPGNAGLALGDQVELEVIAAGCAYGGHQGHVWVDGVGAKVPGLFVSAVGPSAQNAGGDITYTVSYNNGGTASAGGVKVDFTTPPNTTWVGLSAPGLTCTQPAVGGTGLVQCTIGGLAPGSSGTLQVTVNIDPSATGTITNGNYSIFAVGLNPLLGPKVYTEITSDAVYTDLLLTKSNGTAGLAWGQVVTYTLVATNLGPTEVIGATVTDIIPAELTGATWECAVAGDGSCGAPSGTGDLSATVDLPAGASATFTVTASVVSGSGTGSVTNTASIGVPSGITDSNPSNDIDADTDAIGELRTVSVTKLGTGLGSVVSAPAAISCGTSCTSASASFLEGADVALNAVAALGYAFTGWGGDCASSGISSQCNVTLSGDLSATATFSVILTADGQACNGNTDCANGHCADGLCCNTACAGQCEACDVSGSLGACSAVTGDPRGPRTACATDTTACGGACDGTNRTACAYAGGGTGCRPASCASGVSTLAAVCNGAGACPALVTELCAPFECGVSACLTACTFDTDCAANSHCTAGECLADLAPGAACTLDEDCLSGHCTDAVCCDTACGDPCEACNVSVGSAGTCTPVSGAPRGERPACTSDGSACAGACDGVTTVACTYPDADVTCRAGSCTAGTATLAASCHGAGTCPVVQTQPCPPFSCGASACLGDCSVTAECSVDNYCSAGVCVPTLVTATACAGDDQCQSGNCVDDFCCDTACDGQCEACDVANLAGTCTAVSGPPHGARSLCDSDGSVCGGACDGATRGSCAYPDGSIACRAASCAGGAATLAAGCDGLGACPAVQTQPCAPFTCGASLCLGDCSAETDCNLSTYCSGGVCVPTLDPAAACTTDDQCASTHCSDGVCCDTGCSGQCEACNETDTAGTCMPVSGTPRSTRAACNTDGSACGGACDGVTPATCAYPNGSVVCGAPSCAAGVATLPSVCDSLGNCSATQTQPCAPFTCGLSACLGDCGTAADCSVGDYCSAGICVPLLEPAAACVTDDQCESTHCVDGVCCDTVCTGQCEACDAAPTVGTCTAISGDPHAARPRCDGAGDCAATCDGVSSEACIFPSSGTECLAARCRAGAARTASLCDGSGVCVAGETATCGDYACSGAICRTSCAANDDCARGTSCVGDRCVEGSGAAGAGNEAGGTGAGESGGSGGHAGQGGGRAGSGAESGAGGDAGAVAEGGRSGTAGSGAAGRPGATPPPTKNPSSSFEGGGCSCRTVGGNRRSSAGYLLVAFATVALLGRRRKVARAHLEAERRRRLGSKQLGIALVLGVAALFYATTSHARGFALDRFNPSERGSHFFSADSLDIAGSPRVAAGLVADFAHKPLVLRDASGNEIAPVISDQFFFHFGANITLMDRVRLGFNLPLLVFQDASSVVGPTGTVSPSTSPTLGDLRMSADVRLFGKTDEVITVALGVRFYLPTGSPAAFTSDGYFSLLPQARVAGRIGPFIYAADAGVWVRGDRDFAEQPVGSELIFGGATRMIALDDRLVVAPEVWASSVISDGAEGFFGRTSTPVELALGAHYEVVSAWRVGAGVGTGLSSGMGSPAARYLLSVEWVPPVAKPQPPPPPPPPLAEQLPSIPLDSDGDGVADPTDACPQEAGHASEDPRQNGCPLPAAPLPPADGDGDGILDPADACPQEAGTPNADPPQNGCPRAIVTAGEIKILDRVEFEPGQATLRPESNEVLGAVATALKSHPEITRLSVEGHTDDRGVAAQNVGLSQRRAAAVVAWLVEQGIDPARLVLTGFGAARPLESNGAESGRRTNRRVEFRIVRRAAQSTP